MEKQSESTVVSVLNFWSEGYSIGYTFGQYVFKPIGFAIGFVFSQINKSIK
jgi:hypothetical protein